MKNNHYLRYNVFSFHWFYTNIFAKQPWLTLFHLTSSAPFLDEFDKQNSLLACNPSKMVIGCKPSFAVFILLLFTFQQNFDHNESSSLDENFSVPWNIINIQYFKMEGYEYSPPFNGPDNYLHQLTIYNNRPNRERITTNTRSWLLALK